uniref:ATP-dependent 6-phosphofructokinase n=3 Tax=Setaria TaxID=4554 RepID=K3ZDH8_SETIT
MYRAAGSHLRSLKHHGATRLASTSVVKQSQGGLFGWLLGGKSSQLPPLDVPLPGITIPPPLPDFVEPSKTKITTLPNGVKIASETSASPAVSVGLYIDCGSIYETPASSGVSHLLERMAFKSTVNRSHLRLVREVEAIGGNVSASASREQMSYTYDALKSYTPEMVEVLIDSVRNPAFLDWEVKEQLQKIKSEIAEVSANPQGLLLEALHSAGYSGALAKPLMASESAVNRLDVSILEEFVAEHYTAPRMVLAASGVEHDTLVSVVEPLLSDLPSVKRPEEPKSVYVGGDYRCQADSPSTHIALAFEVPGGWNQEKTAMVVTVLQMLMGGGGSFSAGGPGKGMHSRLYLRILTNYQQIESFSAFNSVYNNSGLFGIYAVTSPDFSSKAVDLAAGELLEIATPGKVSQEQLDRAKEATKSAVLMNLESRSIASEDIGRQVLTYGERKPIEYFLKTVEEITLNDISSTAKKIMSSPLTMASWGDVIHVPSYESVSRKFHSKPRPRTMASHIILPPDDADENHHHPQEDGEEREEELGRDDGDEEREHASPERPPKAALPFSATCVRISRDSYPNLRALRNASSVSLADAAYVKISEGDFGYVLDDVPHLTDYVPDIPTYPNPLQDHPAYSTVKQYFVNEDDTVPQKVVVQKNSRRGVHFRRAGPRQRVYFGPDEVKACIVTCGGLCPGLNTVIRELVCGLSHMYNVNNIYGIQNGYKGFYSSNYLPLTPKSVNDIHKRGGTVLGTSRGGHDTKKIVDNIQDRGINQVYIIGGDGTQKGAYEIFKEIRKRGLKVSVAGVPKTIDNDIAIIDKSFGFDTAVEEAQRAIDSAHVEACSAENGIGLVKLMGRYSGFIAMYATLASRDVDCCLIPESPFYMDGEGGLLQYIERRLKENRHMVIVVAEGAGQDLIAQSIAKSDQQDASGNKLLLDIGLWLTHKIKDYFKSKKMEMTIKYIDPTYMIRAIPSNASDNVYCTLLAHSAIHGAMAGYSFTVGMVNGRHTFIPFYRVTSTRNKVRITDRMWARLLSSTNQPSFLSQKDIDEASEADRLANRPPLPTGASHRVASSFEQSASTSSNGEI